jgi:hypothetical protein
MALLIIFSLGLVGRLCLALEITVAAAIDLQGVMPAVTAQFQKRLAKL